MLSLISATMRAYGLTGVALLMLVENLIPVIPSEIIMPLAGFEAAKGTFDPIGAVAVGTLGSVVGGAAWYALARRLGARRFARWADRYGRWLTVSRRDVARGRLWFRRWGALSVFVGRALPGVRGVVCVPAGLAAMPFGFFLIWSSLGALVWTSLLTTAGYVLKANYTVAERWIGPIGGLFFGFCLSAYVFRLLRPRRARQKDLGCVEPGE